MPNWTKIAQTMAQGEFGEDWDKEKMRKQEIASADQRSRLLESAESRAQAGEARESEASEYGKTRRGAKEQAELAALTAAGLNNQQAEIALTGAKKKQEAYDLAGGAQGEANETVADRKRRQSADDRAETALGYEGQRVGVAQGELGLRKDREKREAEFDAQANPLRIERMESDADPRQRYSADITAMSRMYESAVRNGNSDEAARWQSMIEKMAMRQEAESAAWSERRRKRTGGSAPPQDKPQPTAKERAAASAGAWGKR